MKEGNFIPKNLVHFWQESFCPQENPSKIFTKTSPWVVPCGVKHRLAVAKDIGNSNNITMLTLSSDIVSDELFASMKPQVSS